MVKVMFGTPVNIPNYEGTCVKCGNHISVKEIRGVFLSENTTNFSKHIRVTSDDLYCPHCDKLIAYLDLYSPWHPSMFARCN